MRFTIFGKLFLALTGVSMFTLVILSTVAVLNLRAELQHFINEKEYQSLSPLLQALSRHYQQHSGWDFLREDDSVWSNLLRQNGLSNGKPLSQRSLNNPPFNEPPHFKGSQPPLPPKVEGERSASKTPPTLPLVKRIGLNDRDGDSVIAVNSHKPQAFSTHSLAIRVDNQIVGYLAIDQPTQLSGELVTAVIQHQNRALLLSALGALVVAMVSAYVLVRHFLKPLGALSAGTAALASGQLEHRITTTSTDELGDLIHHFNQLGMTLQEQKTLRDHWLSDISHELRTPLSVLRSEIEALQDGIRQPEPRYIKSLHDHVCSLSKLVDDLHALSLSEIDERYDFAEADWCELVQAAADRHALRFAEKGIVVNVQTPPTPLRCALDRNRINQLLDNLLQNSYRYTDCQGTLDIRVVKDGEHARLSIADSAPGVPDAALSHLFQRLYRVDASRTRSGESAGGSGLGLAICDSIVRAHHGTITATHSKQGGVQMTVVLPLKSPTLT